VTEEEFKEQFKVTFLATWAATNYNEYCMNSMQEALSNPPIEDAIFLADEAWKKLESI
jgi:hypothetical protein